MARRRPGEKPDPDILTTPGVLPMQFRVGDRLTDSTGEWEVVGRPDTTAGDKTAHVRLQRVGQSSGVEVRTWGAHEKVSARRANDKEPTP